MRQFTISLLLLLVWLVNSCATGQELAPATPITFTTQYLEWSLSAEGRLLHFIDHTTGVEYAQASHLPFAGIVLQKRTQAVTAITLAQDVLTLTFGDTGVQARIRIVTHQQYFVVEVLDLNRDDVESLTFLNISTTLKAHPNDPFACCAIALNLPTRVIGTPLLMSHLQATGYRRFGIAGAKVAVCGCPMARVNDLARVILTQESALPHSVLGGPWAPSAPDANAWYLICTSAITEQTVKQWIDLAKASGCTQINIMGNSSSFRFGDYRLNPKRYPQGEKQLRAVTDQLHAAGLKVGIHAYSFMIATDSSYVTPKPDKRLAKSASYTLATPIAATDTAVPIQAPPLPVEKLSGDQVIQIDDELLIVSHFQEAPGATFTGCTRGAYGTHASAHAAGATVSQLKMRFSMFAPDPATTLFDEIAQNIANLYNAGGFDMLYIDAIDGANIFAGREFDWYYEAKFAYRVQQSLQRPAVMEMSDMTNHLWAIRSRTGALDYPYRGYRPFIDAHLSISADNDVPTGLPVQLGWWPTRIVPSLQAATMFPEDIEYLCCKALAVNAGLSFIVRDEPQLAASSAWQQTAAILHRYADLRQRTDLSPALREQLRTPGQEYTLLPTAQLTDKPVFQQIEHRTQKVDGSVPDSYTWSVKNAQAAQPLRLRIQALPGIQAATTDSTLLDLTDVAALKIAYHSPKVTCAINQAKEPLLQGKPTLCVTATNDGETLTGACAKVGATFAHPVSVAAHPALGVWIFGDGNDEVVNVQIANALSPGQSEASRALNDHYIHINFRGWRYCQLLEPEANALPEYGWPYMTRELFRNTLEYTAISSCAVWYTHLRPHTPVTCYFGPIMSLAVSSSVIHNPTIKCGDATLTFPVALSDGYYIEYRSPTDCALYDAQGNFQRAIVPHGTAPTLQAGDNTCIFSADNPPSGLIRAEITLTIAGKIIGGANEAH